MWRSALHSHLHLLRVCPWSLGKCMHNEVIRMRFARDHNNCRIERERERGIRDERDGTKSQLFFISRKQFVYYYVFVVVLRSRSHYSRFIFNTSDKLEIGCSAVFYRFLCCQRILSPIFLLLLFLSWASLCIRDAQVVPTTMLRPFAENSLRRAFETAEFCEWFADTRFVISIDYHLQKGNRQLYVFHTIPSAKRAMRFSMGSGHKCCTKCNKPPCLFHSSSKRQ